MVVSQGRGYFQGRSYVVRLFVLLLFVALLGASCSRGIVGKVNASKDFESKWKLKFKGLAGGREDADILLKVHGDKFAMHMVVKGKGVDPGTTLVTTSDALYDGKNLWRYNIRGKIIGTTFGGRPFKQTFKTDKIFKYPIKEGFAEKELFWKIPVHGTKLEEKGREKLAGGEVVVLERRVSTALGTDAIYRYYVDPEMFYVRRALFGYAQGAGQDVSAWEREYECIDYKTETFSDKDFTYTPAGGDVVEKEYNSFFD